MSETTSSTTPEPTLKFDRDLHCKYVKSLEIEKPERFEYWVTEHLRVSGIYWGFVSMSMMNALHEMDVKKASDFIFACQREEGGFGGHVAHDAHIVTTYNALQVLAMAGDLDKVDADKVANWITSLQNSDGSFSGDQWGEIDTRFVYCAFGALSLLKRLHVIDVKKTVRWILTCKNFDEAFGVVPEAESHAGQTFCCVAALSIVNALHLVDQDLLGWWLSERQVTNGGLNGRPEKLADVCYSWWVLSSLAALKKLEWIDREALINFILKCQDLEDGGISDKPGNTRDVYHTCFGCTGLSFLGYEGFAPVDHRYCMPQSVIDKLGLPEQPMLVLD